ncbi:MAG TPA: hypothetical protein VIL40_04975 [Thermaerobacter sp.]
MAAAGAILAAKGVTAVDAADRDEPEGRRAEGEAASGSSGREQEEVEAGTHGTATGRVRHGAGGPVVPVDGGVPGPRSPEAARLWGATYGAGPKSGTDYEATRQSTESVRAVHRIARGPGNPRGAAASPRSEEGAPAGGERPAHRATDAPDGG